MFDIPIYTKKHDKIIAVIPLKQFKPNLNIGNTPGYNNESCNMGLIRIPQGKYKGNLAILYENECYPDTNWGEIISDHQAYELCINRGKTNIINKLNIEWNHGIIIEDDEV